ncbi:MULTISPECIES: ATP phosphoribosyltransferase regulatory subunit [unclassified Roseitalea]|uniref:ATP phosphoribosyltransferase regulatory subunit n=1 Tax=unclassified Roseitalea TaxID=2639107 RepID=UPI00273F91A4|nr:MULTISPECIES: ATP phosphoribosyltransferase regulatory subunit [unclassified Roseitalea]
MTAHRSFAARADIEAIIAERGAQRIDVPVLQPADPFLDTAGEELRRRIFVTQSETGGVLCLRPEFTIPVCLAHLARNGEPARHGYVGTVFRQRRAGPSEFLQAGIEDIGETDRMAADARSIGDAGTMLARLGVPAERLRLVVGDQTVFDAVLAALGLPAGWRLRLAHAFGSDAALEATLERLAHPAPMPDLPAPIAAPALAGDARALEDAIQADLDASGLGGAGGRGAAEIAERLLAKVQSARMTPDPAGLDMLRAFLAIRVPLGEAADALGAMQRRTGLGIGEAVEAFAARAAAIADAGALPPTVEYRASFGRRLDYYTGLVFEMRGADDEVLAGGGRYDRLLTLLGAPAPIPGVGFSIWLDRVARASGETP